MTEHPAPRHASTVLLLRDGKRGLEVFMMRRHIKSDFVGGAYVFPGGAVDPEDRIDEALCRGPSDAQASERLRIDHGGLAFCVAAIRECFEEAGILYAYDQSGRLIDFADQEREDRYKELRHQLNQGELSMLEVAAHEDLVLATDQIHYWAHWITPEGQPRRYDTRFFVALAPDFQTAEHDDWELVNSAWVTPREAIDKALDREWMIIFPTMKNLERLEQFGSAAEAIAWADAQSQVPANQPRVRLEPAPARIVLPGDDGYESAERDATKADPGLWFRQFEHLRRS